MDAIAAKYLGNLPTCERRIENDSDSTPRVVLLTGSTGSLGSYLLQELINESRIHHIYCLNRPGTAPSTARQKAVSNSRGLNTEFHSKVTFLEGDLAQAHFSLSKPTYATLLQTVTHTIHNAWPVNFLRPLRYFEPQLQSIRHLVDFCAGSSQNATLFFTSTIGVAMAWAAMHDEPLPERLLDWSVDPMQGYSQAKLIAERILAEASRVSGVRTQICRIGQVTGPTTREGSWNKGEWFPSMLASSASIGVIPNHLGPGEQISWMPVNLLAGVIMDLCFNTPSVDRSYMQTETSLSEVDSAKGLILPPANCEIQHVQNPNKTTYSALLPTILRYMPPHIEQVPFAEWVSRLRKSKKDPGSNPAIRLLEMWLTLVALGEMDRHFVAMDTTTTAGKSAKLKSMPAATRELMANYMQQWGYETHSKARL